MPDVEPKEHWKTREARLRREAAAATPDVETGAEAPAEDRAVAIAESMRGPDPAMVRGSSASFELHPDPTALTIEGRVGLPPRDTDTPITPEMTPEDVQMLVEKASRHVMPKAAPAGRIRTTTFVNPMQSVPSRAPEVIQTYGAALRGVPNDPIPLEAKGQVMDFVEFCNRRFTQMDKAGCDAIMQSSQPQPAMATLRKLYVAYIFAVRHAKAVEDAAFRGQMD